MSRKSKKSPPKNNNNANNQNTPAPNPPKRWWQNILETNKVIAGGTILAAVVAAIVGWFLWDETHEANLATWEQGRAHLEVADTPESSIKIMTDSHGVATISGILYIVNQGPSDAAKPTIEVAIGLEEIGQQFEFLNGNIIDGAFTQPDKIAAPGAGTTPTPIGIPFGGRINPITWMPFDLLPSGVIHIRARVHFTDIYKHVQHDDVEATTFWDDVPFMNSVGFQRLERRDALPTGIRHPSTRIHQNKWGGQPAGLPQPPWP